MVNKSKALIKDFGYRTIFEQSPISTQILSPKGTTLMVNKAWEKLWGISLDQIPDYNILKDQQLEEKGLMPYIKKGFSGEPTIIPTIRYEPNRTNNVQEAASYRWVRAFIYPVKNNRKKISYI